MTIKPGGHDDPGAGLERRLRHRVPSSTGSSTSPPSSSYRWRPRQTQDVVEHRLASGEADLGPDGAQLHPRSAQQRAATSIRRTTRPQAAAARRIQGFHELDGIEFLARVDVEKDAKGLDRNVVKLAVEPDHPDYARFMDMPAKANGRRRLGALRRRRAPAYRPRQPAPQRGVQTPPPPPPPPRAGNGQARRGPQSGG